MSCPSPSLDSRPVNRFRSNLLFNFRGAGVEVGAERQSESEHCELRELDGSVIDEEASTRRHLKGAAVWQRHA